MKSIAVEGAEAFTALQTRILPVLKGSSDAPVLFKEQPRGL